MQFTSFFLLEVTLLLLLLLLFDRVSNFEILV